MNDRQHAARLDLDAMRQVSGRDPALPPEWRACIAYLCQMFDGQMPEADRAAWACAAEDLGITPGQARTAAMTLARHGRRFIPSVQAVAAALGQTATPIPDQTPTFPEAWSQIARAIRRGPLLGQTWLDQDAHPSVAAWARHAGLARLARLPVDCPDHGHLARRDLERSWTEHARAWTDPAARARLARPPSAGRQGLRRPDLAALIPPPPQEAA